MGSRNGTLWLASGEPSHIATLRPTHRAPSHVLCGCNCTSKFCLHLFTRGSRDRRRQRRSATLGIRVWLPVGEYWDRSNAGSRRDAGSRRCVSVHDQTISDCECVQERASHPRRYFEPQLSAFRCQSKHRPATGEESPDGDRGQHGVSQHVVPFAPHPAAGARGAVIQNRSDRQLRPPSILRYSLMSSTSSV